MIKAADWRRRARAAMGAGPGGEEQRDARTQAADSIPFIMTISLVSANGFIACRIYSIVGRNQGSHVRIKH